MNNPISILLPVYNGAKYLSQAIESVLGQNVNGWELIIVNDGSTDESFSVAQEFEQEVEGKKIKALSLSDNFGQSYARNFAFNNCVGDFIAYIDADDVWQPSHLMARYEAFKNEPELDFVYGPITDMVGETVGKPRPSLWGENLAGHEREALREANIIIPSAVMHRRKPFELLGGFPEGIVCGEDGVLWRRMAEAGYKFKYINLPTFYYRSHNNNQNKVLHETAGSKHLIGKQPFPNGQELDGAWAEQMKATYGENWKEVVKK